MCASEKAAIGTAYGIIEDMGEDMLNFSDHVSGAPVYNIVRDAMSEGR